MNSHFYKSYHPIPKISKKRLHTHVKLAILDAMYVRTLIFLTALIAVTGSVRAGVISALWVEQGCGSIQNAISDPTPVEPTPGNRDQCPQEGLFCSASTGGSGMSVTSFGSNFSSFAVAVMFAMCVLTHKIQGFLRRHDVSLPPSPVLVGLLEPP